VSAFQGLIFKVNIAALEPGNGRRLMGSFKFLTPEKNWNGEGNVQIT